MPISFVSLFYHPHRSVIRRSVSRRGRILVVIEAAFLGLTLCLYFRDTSGVTHFLLSSHSSQRKRWAHIFEKQTTTEPRGRRYRASHISKSPLSQLRKHVRSRAIWKEGKDKSGGVGGWGGCSASLSHICFDTGRGT